MLAQNNHKLKQSATKKPFYLHVSSLYVTALLISPIHKELSPSPPPTLTLACTSAHTMTSEVLETKFVFQCRDLQWRTCLSSRQKSVNFHNSQTHTAGLQPFIISLDIAYFLAATALNSATNKPHIQSYYWKRAGNVTCFNKPTRPYKNMEDGFCH